MKLGVDLVVDCGRRPIPIEIKSASTFKTEFANGVELFKRLYDSRSGFVVYNGSMDLPPYRSVVVVNPLANAKVWSDIIDAD